MRWCCLLLLVGCQETAVQRPVPVVEQVMEAQVVDPLANFKMAGRLVIEDMRRPVTPAGLDPSWEAFRGEYQQARTDGRAVRDAFDSISHLRVIWNLHWKEIAMSQKPWDHRLLADELDKAEKTLNDL